MSEWDEIGAFAIDPNDVLQSDLILIETKDSQMTKENRPMNKFFKSMVTRAYPIWLDRCVEYDTRTGKAKSHVSAPTKSFRRELLTVMIYHLRYRIPIDQKKQGHNKAGHSGNDAADAKKFVITRFLMAGKNPAGDKVYQEMSWPAVFERVCARFTTKREKENVNNKARGNTDRV